MPQPVQQARAWLTRVARNRIIDRFRRRSRERPADPPAAAGEELDDGADDGAFEDLLPAPDGGPESAFIRELLLEEIEAALGELPREQREVFVAHELDGVSFRELSARSGVSVNTLLARKRYAVLHLRQRLRAAWDDWLLT
ncbi:MAG: sigma-70 family RNA polymerase sigma factor [Gammaproteobacteria bacterium]|nr:MAG: sigma-70 family RNA polymerase sigma factor [Gammaproteobacteria bacterium]